MRGMLAVLFFTLLTTFCWGIYGPVLRNGQSEMGGGLRPFVCVGLAYFLIGVIVPSVLIQLRGEAGHWSASGTIWSFVAGVAGALGALGVILAFSFGGNPLYAMPLIFGGAPVINTFVTMRMGGNYREAGPIFYAGLILVVTGAITVLIFKPQGSHGALTHEMTFRDWGLVAGSIALAACCWGTYGPLLHKGQSAMAGSRLRPLICVGMAYFLIAVLVPGILLSMLEKEGHFSWEGTLWSLAGGAAGAIGALGIIMAFNFGGKPIYVMPLVFGGAPVINTFTTMIQSGTWGEPHPFFYAGLLIVIGGAVTVLLFAPRGKPHATGKPPVTPQPAKV